MSDAVRPHVRLTPDQVKANWKQGFYTPKGYLYHLLSAMKAIGWKITILNVKEFCEAWEIARRTFFRAKAQLLLDGLLAEEIEGRLHLWIKDDANLDTTDDKSGASDANPDTLDDNSGTHGAKSGTLSDKLGTQGDNLGTGIPLKPLRHAGFEDSPDLIQISSQISDQTFYSDLDQREKTHAREIEVEVEVFSEPCSETLDRGDEKNKVPTGAAQISRSGNISPVEAFEKRFSCRSSSDPDYARFKGAYMQICAVIDGNYGKHDTAQQAWQDFRDEVGEIPEAFWDGLEAYRQQKVKQFQSEGRAIGVKGAANWLRDREWEFALQRQAVLDQASQMGVNLTDKQSVKMAAIDATNRAASERVRAQIEAMQSQGAC